MVSETEDYTKRQQQIHTHYKHKLKILPLIIITNFLTFYVFNGPDLKYLTSYYTTSRRFLLQSCCHETLLTQLATTNEGITKLNSTKLLLEEKTRWLVDRGLDYGINQVLAGKTVRIGLDIGGTGTFATSMKERNVTILTTSMNLDCPFNSFIASRGLISRHMSVSQRLPFFENTLDIVHSMHVLSNLIPDDMLEFLLYDIYRVLRPGGLFWVDHFFCFGSQLNGTYVPKLNRIGFKKLMWNAGRKLDKKNEWYFSALFEKPMT